MTIATMDHAEVDPADFVRLPFRLGVFFRWWRPGKRERLPAVAARFFQWWVMKPSHRRDRVLYRSGRAAKRQHPDVNVGVQPLDEIGYAHNPDMSGHRWIEPMPCADDAEDSWDDAVYLGAGWERFVDADTFDPFRGCGAAFARLGETVGNETRVGRMR